MLINAGIIRNSCCEGGYFMGLIVNELTKKFGEKTAVDHLSFSMEGPGVFGLLGTNGAGKTTTIRTILGIMSPDSGSATWNNTPIKMCIRDRCSGAHFKRI